MNKHIQEYRKKRNETIITETQEKTKNTNSKTNQQPYPKGTVINKHL